MCRKYSNPPVRKLKCIKSYDKQNKLFESMTTNHSIMKCPHSPFSVSSCVTNRLEIFSFLSNLPLSMKDQTLIPPPLFVFSNFKNFQLINLKFDGYFDKSFLQTLSLQLPPSGVVGSSSKGGKVGSLIKMECHTSAKIPKRGEEYQSQGSNSRD